MLERLTDQEMADVALVVETSLRLGFKAVEFAIRKNKDGAKKAAENFQQAAPQIFKGNIYDLSYFWGYDNLPFSVIESIPKELRKAVMQNFDSLMQQGYVTSQNKAVVLTEKGKKFIDEPEFIRAAIQDRTNGIGDIKKVLEQEYNRRIAERGAARTPNVPGINYHDGLVSNTNEIIAEAGQKTTQKAVLTGTEHAAMAGVTVAHKGAETAVKSGVKAGTGAAAGAATMGVATAAQIGYELAKGSIKAVQEKVLK